MSAKTNSPCGAALVEVLIVMVLSSLLIGLFLHADLAVNRSILRWAQRSSLEQAAQSLGQRLRKDINRSDSLGAQGTRELEIYSNGHTITRYSFDDSTVTRNGQVILRAPITVAEYSFNPLISDLENFSLGIGSVGSAQRVLTITLKRGDLATQTMIVPLRPYAMRHIE